MPKRPERNRMRQRTAAASSVGGILLRAIANFDTATLYEAAGQQGAMVPEIRPLARGTRMAGPALTVACPPGDNLMLHAAVADAAPGDVLVAQCHDFTVGVWGEVLMTAAQARGIAGLILDGAVRDVGALERAGFPVFCRAVSMRAATKARRGILRMPVTGGGQLVRPGGVVGGDETGGGVFPVAGLGDGVGRGRGGQERGAEVVP